MRIRKNIMPRRLVDVLCFLLIGVCMPIIFIFEMIIVLPAIHVPGGFFHSFTFLLAMFLVFNIKGNMIACIMVDTSANYYKSSDMPPSDSWRYCDSCKGQRPPRSWHCKVCRTCILKRDHHCLFTGCCIGHFNHRYFIMFIFYLFIGSTYALVYNSFYLWILKGNEFRSWLSLLKMMCPMIMFATGSLWQNLHLVFYNLNILAFIYSVVLLGYHFPLVLRGNVSHERGKGKLYDAGWHTNLENVFGKRIHLVWLSPFVKSQLPHNGTQWKAMHASDQKCD